MARCLGKVYSTGEGFLGHGDEARVNRSITHKINLGHVVIEDATQMFGGRESPPRAWGGRKFELFLSWVMLMSIAPSTIALTF
jgi:hypothetical protein